MILIDATYINSGGGKVLLDLLIQEIITKNIKAFFLLDFRISKNYPYIDDLYKTSINPSVIERHLFYLKNKDRFNVVLCFANVPPTLNLNYKVYTFFQNVDLLKNISLKSLLKKYFIKLFVNNSDGWIVQTETVSKLIQKIGVKKNRICIYPFYREFSLPKLNRSENILKYIYVSSGERHKNHKRLLKAFKKYHSVNNNVQLILTIEKRYDWLCKKIDSLIKEGIPIKNIGIVSKEQLHKEYINANFAIYPSFYESFGLGLVEACQYNLPIIASNMDYVKEVTEPSILFNPDSEKSILKALIKSKKSIGCKSNLKVENNINKVIKLLSLHK